VLSQTAVKHVLLHTEYYKRPHESPQAFHLLRDSDGQVFLNYLADTVHDDAEGGTDFNAVKRHRQVVEERLALHAQTPPIWGKYAWAANYHNYFCQTFLGLEDKDLLIDMARVAPRPAPLIAIPKGEDAGGGS
jgi:hypothetical protein